MTDITLESLGLSEDTLIQKLVDRIAENLLTSLEYDEDGGEWYGKSPFAKKLDKLVKDRLDKIVNKMADEHVLPRVNELVENMVLQQTNKWGEAVGKPVTFREYLTQRAETWMTEEVNYDGKVKGQDSFSWRAYGTRVAYMIDKHFQFEIERALKDAFAQLNSTVAKGLHETLRIQINSVLNNLKINVKTN